MALRANASAKKAVGLFDEDFDTTAYSKGKKAQPKTRAAPKGKREPSPPSASPSGSPQPSFLEALKDTHVTLNSSSEVSTLSLSGSGKDERDGDGGMNGEDARVDAGAGVVDADDAGAFWGSMVETLSPSQLALLNNALSPKPSGAKHPTGVPPTSAAGARVADGEDESRVRGDGESAVSAPLDGDVHGGEERRPGDDGGHPGDDGVEEQSPSMDHEESPSMDHEESPSIDAESTSLDVEYYRSTWPKLDRHFFILSNSGRPIYSRHGDEQDLASFTGLLQILMESHMFRGDGCATDNELLAVCAGAYTMAFMARGPLFYVCVSGQDEPLAELQNQLSHLHALVLSITTAAIFKIYRKNQSFDVRPMLAGTSRLFHGLFAAFEDDCATLLHAINSYPVVRPKRQAIAGALRAAQADELVYSLLFVGRRVVTYVEPAKHPLHADDLHLIMNFVLSNDSFREAETWNRICLPHFNKHGYFHCYVAYLGRDACLFLLSTSFDSFKAMQECKKQIEKSLGGNALLKGRGDERRFSFTTSSSVLRARPDRSDTAPPRKHKSSASGESAAPSLTLPKYRGPSSSSVPSTIHHFMYLQKKPGGSSNGPWQFYYPSLRSPYRSKEERRRMIRLYQHIHHRSMQTYSLASDDYSEMLRGASVPRTQRAQLCPHKLLYFVSGCEVVLAWIDEGYHLYVVGDAMSGKEDMIRSSNQLIRLLQKEERHLLMGRPPTW